MDQVKSVLLENKRQKYDIDRVSFLCMELNIPTDGEWMKHVLDDAGKIFPNLNVGQANTSEKRAADIVEIDNLSGVIAESACYDILRWQFGNENISKPLADNAVNQIDIKLKTGKTIEVRSSCVQNGIDFAVFKRDKSNHSRQYFDVIGPYTNGYKPGEYLKDYYMRVLYWCDKKQFMTLLDRPVLTLFLTGGATKAMMLDPNIYQNKHLVPAGGQVQKESDYRVIPLGKSLDAKEFFELMSRENGFILKHPV